MTPVNDENPNQKITTLTNCIQETIVDIFPLHKLSKRKTKLYKNPWTNYDVIKLRIEKFKLIKIKKTKKIW